MTDRPTTFPAGPGALERGRVLAHFDLRDLWVHYLGLGGESSPADVEAYLADTKTPSRREYNLLADALNERLMDLGLFDRVGYAV